MATIIESTTHIEGQWSNVTSLTFGLKAPYNTDTNVAYYKYILGVSVKPPTSANIPRGTTTTVNMVGFDLIGPIWYISVYIYNSSNTVIGTDSYQIKLDFTVPAITNAYIETIPIFQNGPFTIGVQNASDPGSGSSLISKIRWEYEVVDVGTYFFEVLNPNTSDPNWKKHTFNTPHDLVQGKNINIKVQIWDNAGNTAFTRAGYDFGGDYLGRLGSQYVVEYNLVYKFSIWDYEIKPDNINNKRCTNSGSYLRLEDECKLHEANISFPKGLQENCPNCNYPLVETELNPINLYFNSNFNPNTPSRGDDDGGAGIISYDLNRRYYSLHKRFFISEDKKDIPIGMDFIRLGTYYHNDIEDRLALAHFEISFYDNNNKHIYSEDSFSGYSGFKFHTELTDPIDIQDWNYILNGSFLNGTVGYESKFRFTPGVEYFYKWRLILVYSDGSRSYQSYIEDSHTFESLTNPTSEVLDYLSLGTITSTVLYNSLTISVPTGIASLIQVGDFIRLFQGSESNYLGAVLSKTSNTITVEKPTQVQFTSGAEVRKIISTYKESLIEDGSFEGFYKDGLLSTPNSIRVLGIDLTNSKYILNTTEYKFRSNNSTSSILTGTFSKYNNLTNRLIVKVKASTSSISVAAAAIKGLSGSLNILSSYIALEKDKWSVLIFDLENTIVYDNPIGQINPVSFQNFTTNNPNAIGINLIGCQANYTDIEVDYIALVSKVPKKRYFYLNIRTENGACFNDNRISSFISDNAPVSNCSQGFKPVLAGAPNNYYQSGLQRCYNDICPKYSSIQGINDYVEYIFDSTGPISRESVSNIPVYESLSGLLVCPNDNKLPNGDQVCSNNALRILLFPENKICSRDEGVFFSGQYNYRCSKFSISGNPSIYDTSGNTVPTTTGTKIPASRISVPTIFPAPTTFDFKRLPPNHYFWTYNNNLLKCDGILRDTGLACGSTLVGYSSGQKCPICNTTLMRFDDYGLKARALVCSNTNKIYRLIYNCSLFQVGKVFNSNVTQCTECGEATEFVSLGKPIIEKFTTNNNITLNRQEIDRFLSGHRHTRATVGWNPILNIQASGYIGGYGGPFVSNLYTNVVNFRPTLAGIDAENEWDAKIAKSNTRKTDANTRSLQIANDLKALQFNLIQEYRKAGDPEPYFVKTTQDATFIYTASTFDNNQIIRFGGANINSSGYMEVLGEPRTNQTASGNSDEMACWSVAHQFRNYHINNGRFLIRTNIKSLTYRLMSTASVPYQPTGGSSGHGGYVAGSGTIGWLWVTNGVNGFTSLGSLCLGRDIDANLSGSIMKTGGGIAHRINKRTNRFMYYVDFRLATFKLTGQATPSGARYRFFIYAVPKRVKLHPTNSALDITEYATASGVDFPIINIDVTSTFWNDSQSSPPNITSADYLFNNLNFCIDFMIQGSNIIIRGIKNVGTLSEISTSYTFANHGIFDNNSYFGFGGNSSEHLKMEIINILFQGEPNDFAKVNIQDITDSNSCLRKYGSYTRDTQVQYDESDLLRIVNNSETSKRFLLRANRQTENYYRIEIDPKVSFDSRNGKPMRVIEAIGYTCLSKTDKEDGSTSHNWQSDSQTCPNYKTVFSKEQAEGYKFVCPICNRDLNIARLDKEAIALITAPMQSNPKSSPLINKLLNLDEMPGDAESDYLMIDVNKDGSQDHDEQSLIQNKFFDTVSKRYQISNWSGSVTKAQKVTSGVANEYLSDIDFSTQEQLKSGSHPSMQYLHPLGHPATLLWMSVGRAKILADPVNGLIRSGLTAAEYIYNLEQTKSYVSNLLDIDAKKEFSDIMFSYYIPRGLLYRSVWERGNGKDTWPSGVNGTGDRLTNKEVYIEFSIGNTALSVYSEIAKVRYYIWSDALRDPFEINNTDTNINPLGKDFYNPEKNPFEKWIYKRINLYSTGQKALAEVSKNWTHINTIKFRVVLRILRNQPFSAVDVPINPSFRPNHVGIIIGEFQQGWKGRATLQSGKEYDQYGPRTFDGVYNWRVIPYVLKQNPVYYDWLLENFPDLAPSAFADGSLEYVYNNESAVYNSGFSPKRLITRYDYSQANIQKGIMKISKNWTTILDRQDIVIPPDGMV